MTSPKPFLDNLLRESNGDPSTMRVCVLVLVLFGTFASLVILTVWAYVSVKTLTVAPLGFGEVATLITSAVAVVAKTVSKKFEKEGD